MKHSVSDDGHDGRYFRLTLLACQLVARLAVVLAGLLLRVGHSLPSPLRRWCESVARLCKNMAILIVQPAHIRNSMRADAIRRAALDGFLLGALLGLVVGYYVASSLLIFIIIVPLFFLLLLLINFLSISGDIYINQQDEYQKLISYEASAYTLKVIMILLALLLVTDLFFRAWRADVIAHLGILLLLARLIYLIKLAQLRWREMADVELEEQSEGYGD